MMKNKKMIALAALLAVVLTMVLGVKAAQLFVEEKQGVPAVDETVTVTDGEEEDMEIFELSGEVIELGEGYFVFMDAQMGAVQANFGDDTFFEGVSAQEIALGQFVQVLYDGKMTRSIPAQVFALKVGMYPVSGEVIAVEAGAMTLVRDEIGDEVIVFLPEGAPQIAVGAQVTAYTNGAMTMSIPAQTSALGVVIQ